jgi:hypothetical protein
VTSARDRDLLERVVTAAVHGDTQVEWLDPGDRWSAHARLVGAGGLVSHVLTSPEVQEARFEEPRCSVGILTGTDVDEVQEALAKLARAAVEYSAGGGHVEHERVRGNRPVLVLRTTDGEWRIGKRSGTFPH